MNEDTTTPKGLGPTQATIIQADSDGNFWAGVLGGVIGAVIGAILWGIISVWLDRQIGWMAVGIGVLVGFGVRFLGKGTSIKFGIAGAILAILGCIAGNVVMIYILFSKEFGLSLWYVMTNLSASDLFTVIKEAFQWIDILFYILALYTGYRFAFRKVKYREPSSRP
jgi:hypothetical protein